MDNPEKLATQGTKDEDQTKQKHNTIFVGYHYVQANANNVNKTLSYDTVLAKGKQNNYYLRTKLLIINRHNFMLSYK